MIATGSGRKRAGLVAYAAAVAASAVFQTAFPGLPEPGAGDRAAMVPPQTAEGTAEGPAVRIAYDDRRPADGPAVVLLHGSPGAIADFRHLYPHLEGRFRVLVPDLPGFGRSSRRLPDYSVAAHARYVLAWLDGLGVREFHAVGFSQGGGVALNLADLAPGRVRSVTLVGGIGIQEGEGSGSHFLEHVKYAAMVPSLLVGPELVPHFGLMGSRSFRWTFFRNFWDTDQRPLRGVLERLSAPLLILHGRHDPLVPAWAAVEHHRIVPGSELHLFDDSHFMLFDPAKTDRLAGPLAEFLTRHSGREPTVGTGRTVLYGPEGARDAGPDEPLPESRLWPAAAQVGVPLAVAVISPSAGWLLAGALTGTDRADWFAGWLGATAGFAVGSLTGLRRTQNGPNGRLRAWLWPVAGLGLSAVMATATAMWGGVALVAVAAGWAAWAFRRSWTAWLARRSRSCRGSAGSAGG